MMMVTDSATEAVDRLLRDVPPATSDPREFLAAQFDHGLAWVWFPEGDGGLGLEPTAQVAVDQRLRQAGAPDPIVRNPIGHGMCAPTIARWGTEAQRSRFLRPLFTGEEVWCQLFSEPGAGSDFAGLATRAVRDGDEWIVNGQKVWTTLAHISSWGLLIVRTDPTVVKHQGLSALIVDMHGDGVHVEPLFQMTAEAEFNEVFFADTRVAGDLLLGPEGEGWRVALTTLMNERVAIGGVVPPKGSGPIAELVRAWTELPIDRRAGSRRDTVMKLWTRAEVLRLTNVRLAQQRTRGDPGPEGSIGKVAAADLNKDIYNELVNLLGPEGMLYGSYEKVRPSTSMQFETAQKAFLRSRANSIEGGTTEVMKNILGERVLGLPGDVRTDTAIPWNQVPRG